VGAGHADGPGRRIRHAHSAASPFTEAAIDTLKLIRAICEAATDKKADEIVILEMDRRSAFCDAFVILSAPSSVRVKAIVDHIEGTLLSHGLRPLHKEGYAEASWVLLDYGAVVVHAFHSETRRYYSLEHLWGDAPKRVYQP
jgi:ribosome-associated protein